MEMDMDIDIERIERYIFDGREFSSLCEVLKYIESEIGKVIDSTPNRLAPKDAIAVFDAIIENRERLFVLLGARYITEPDKWQSGKSSIFDL